MRVSKFNKTDGQSSELAGVKRYSMAFVATLVFIDDAWYTTTGGMMETGVRIDTRPIANTPPTCAQDLTACISQAPMRAKKGDELGLKGSASFEKSEAGWHFVDLDLVLPDCSAVPGCSGQGERSTKPASMTPDSHQETAVDRAASASQVITSIVGEWNHGFDCMRIDSTPNGMFMLHLRNCDVDESTAASLVVGTQPDGGFVDPTGNFKATLQANGKLFVVLKTPIKDRVGNLWGQVPVAAPGRPQKKQEDGFVFRRGRG